MFQPVAIFCVYYDESHLHQIDENPLLFISMYDFMLTELMAQIRIVERFSDFLSLYG